MKYMYCYSFIDLLDGEIVENVFRSNERMSLDDLFLNTFIQYTEQILGECLSWEGESDSFPKSISELRDDSIINFHKMEFQLISGSKNLKRKPVFNEKS